MCRKHSWPMPNHPACSQGGRSIAELDRFILLAVENEVFLRRATDVNPLIVGLT